MEVEAVVTPGGLGGRRGLGARPFQGGGGDRGEGPGTPVPGFGFNQYGNMGYMLVGTG